LQSLLTLKSNAFGTTLLSKYPRLPNRAGVR
jgi:hypothetical protein